MLIKPTLPPYDPEHWARQPFATKTQMVCAAWAEQGYGSPAALYGFYVAKIVLYVYGWAAFCSFTPGLGELSKLSVWWASPEAFLKAILFSMLFESVGFGCGSGPLGGHYLPPFGGALYFLRPGTTRLAAFASVQRLFGPRRSMLDVVLYAAFLGCTLWALTSASPSRLQLTYIVALLALLGVLDKTLFLSARAEHYWTTLLVCVLSVDFVPGAKAVQLALWFWAGVSKLNHHFPYVVGVMTSNSPFAPAWLKKKMYRAYPDDLRPSRLATLSGHAGTVLEFAVPVCLGLGNGGTLTSVGVVLMLLLHGFITSNVPAGVPLEWNFMMVYGGMFLFVANAGVSVTSIEALPLAIVLVCAVLVPLLGNLAPARVPFLLSMRYYAGNWACGVWLFKRGAHHKLSKLTTVSPWLDDQLAAFYDPPTIVALRGKVMGFRLMHLHGRAIAHGLQRALPEPEFDFRDYDWVDGELVAGLALGWNFGDGHLHGEDLVSAIQEQCAFEPGELRCVLVESEPFWRGTLHYRVLDAAAGPLTSGELSVTALRALQPWQHAPE